MSTLPALFASITSTSMLPYSYCLFGLHHALVGVKNQRQAKQDPGFLPPSYQDMGSLSPAGRLLPI